MADSKASSQCKRRVSRGDGSDVQDGSVQGRTVSGHRWRHRAGQADDGEVRRAGRRLRDLRPPRQRPRGNRQGDHGQVSRPGGSTAIRSISGGHGGRGNDRADLGDRAARWSGQQRRGQFHFPDQGPQPARLRRHCEYRAARHVLHEQRLRQALDRRQAQGEYNKHSHDLGVDGQSVRRALGDVEGRRCGDDSKPGGRMGPPWHPPQCHRARPLPDRRRLGAARPP